MPAQTLTTTTVALELDESGRARAFRVMDRRWDLGPDGFRFRLWGEPAAMTEARRGAGTLRATLRNEKGFAGLTIAAEDTLRIEVEGAREQSPHCAAPHVEAPAAGAPAPVELEVFLPDDAECHLPAAFNTGWVFSAGMPAGERSRHSLVYQFALARFGEAVLRFSTRSLGKLPDGVRFPSGGRYAAPAVTIERLAGGFRLGFAWAYGGPLHLQGFEGLEAAIAEYTRWLERAFDIQPRGVAPHRPEWLWNTRLAFTVDMWRSHGEIQHTYQHVIDLMRDLRAAGAPRDTLLYLAGWSWRYDGHYPDYRPHPVLGGARKFQEMVSTAHQTGCRLMLHLCGPGFDPYLPGFEAMKAAGLRSTDRSRIPRVWEAQGEERILTWLGGLQTPHPYDSGRQLLPHAWDADGHFLSLATPWIPDRLEACLSIGGIQTAGTEAAVRVRINGRSQGCPAALQSGSSGYRFPFPFYFHPGMNQIDVECLGGEVEDWSTFWYHLHDAMQMSEVWTYPIAGMNINDPAWQRFLVDAIVGLVRGSGIDAVHLDTHHVGVSLWDWRPALARIREHLPGVALGSEVQDEQGLQSFAVTQSSSLWPYLAGPSALDPNARSLMSWHRRSAVSRRITERYLRVYPHLTIPAHFVPVGNIVNHDPPSLAGGRRQQVLEELLANADEMGIVPTLRINYRDYGLDPATRGYVASRGA